MKKHLMTILALLVLFGSFAFGSGAKEKTTEAIELDMPSWAATSPSYGPFFESLIEEFQTQHPNVKIKFYHVPYDGYVDTMVSRFAAGDPPDIFHVPERDLYVFAKEDWFEPLDPVIGDDLKDWIPLQDWCVVDGKTISVLLLGYSYVMAYNEILLEEAGVKLPTEWDDMMDAATRISKDLNGDKVNDQWGLFMSTTDEADFHDVTVSVLSIGLTGEKITSDKGVFSDQVFKRTASYLRELTEKGATPAGASRLIGRDLLAEGKIGMIIDGPWISGFMDKADASLLPRLKVALIPSSLSKGSAGGVSNGLSVPKAIGKEKKEMALEFIKLFATVESQKKFATIAGQPPARKNVLTAEELEKMERMTVFMEAATHAVNNVPFAVATRFGEYRKAIMDPILSHVLRGISLEEATKQARSGVEKLLK